MEKSNIFSIGLILLRMVFLLSELKIKDNDKVKVIEQIENESLR